MQPQKVGGESPSKGGRLNAHPPVGFVSARLPLPPATSDSARQFNCDRSPRSIPEDPSMHRLSAALCLFMLCTAAAIQAQIPTSTVSGIVKDSQGAIVRGAMVVVTSTRSGHHTRKRHQFGRGLFDSGFAARGPIAPRLARRTSQPLSMQASCSKPAARLRSMQPWRPQAR